MKKVNINFAYFTILFFAGSILGWLWEMVAFKCTHSEFGWIEIIQELRGVLHGPWVPIYGLCFVGYTLILTISVPMCGKALTKSPLFI